MVNKLISVVICTCNRPELLGRCLRSLNNQKGDYEILVIDNSSGMENVNKNVVLANRDSNIRYFREEKMGLSYARNKGWKKSEGKYVAFIDDDAIASRKWVAGMQHFIKRHPEVLAFGGPYQAYSTEKVPKWFPNEYASYSLGKKVKILDIGKEWLNGTNMVYRRDLLKRLNGFRSEFGMQGNVIGYGEETDLQIRINSLRIPIYYIPELKVKHLLTKNKMSVLWLWASIYKHGCVRMRSHGEKPQFSKVREIISKGLKSSLKKFIMLPKMPLKKRVFYSLRPVFFSAGIIVEYLDDLKHRIFKNV